MSEIPPSEHPSGEPGLPVPPERLTLPLSAGPFDLGRLVAGRYRIEALLGQGGFGRVYRAFDQKLERVVALKILTLVRGEEVLRFEEEARAVARLDHPHIVTVYDAGAEGEIP